MIILVNDLFFKRNVFLFLNSLEVIDKGMRMIRRRDIKGDLISIKDLAIIQARVTLIFSDSGKMMN